jgi:serralysin
MPNTRPSIIESIDSTIQNPYLLSVGKTAQGNISNTYDYDYYEIPVVAGQQYSFGLIGTGTAPMADPILRILNSGGAQIASNDDLATSHRWSVLTYTSNKTEILTIKVGSYGFDPGGQYGISVSTGSKPDFDYLMGAGTIWSNPSSTWSALKGQGVTVTYGFRETGATYSETSAINTFTKLTPAQISAVNTVMSLWADICGIKFQLVNPSGYTNNATILFGNYYDPNDEAGAFAYKPSSYINTSSNLPDGDVWLNIVPGSISTSLLAPGSYSFNTIMHEVGHALGLTHPSPYQASTGGTTYAANAVFIQDSGQYTVMSYFDNSDAGQASGKSIANVTPMMFDILALQNIYGPNLTTRAGNNIYGFGSNAGSAVYEFNLNSAPQLCIWDAGGSDTLNCSSYSQNQLINLNDGSFSNVGGGISNVSIALNTVIENAIGGNGNDQILGNAYQNVFAGGKGNDAIDGGAGVDKATYSGLLTDYTIRVISGNATITDKLLNRDGSDSLVNIERLQFSNKNLALDLAPTQSAGQTALLLGAVLPGRLVLDVSKQPLLGGVMSLFDQGFTLQQLSGAVLRLPIWDVLTQKANPTNADIATYLVNNVYEGKQSAAITNTAINAMNAETSATQGNYLATLVLSTASQSHIDLVGISQSGLLFT